MKLAILGCTFAAAMSVAQLPGTRFSADAMFR